MSARVEPAQWRQTRERGSAVLLRVMVWLSLRCGRGLGHDMLHVIASYYFLFAPRAARHMRDYLRRALGREPRARDRYRLILWFATTIQDRLYLLSGRHELFEVTLQGEALIREVATAGRGALLFGAHMGSFEVLRTVADRRPGLAISMAMYEDNARKLKAVMGAASAGAASAREPPEIIALGRLDAMLRIRERLDAGAMVGILADRTLGGEASLPVSFLGSTAQLPLGPMRAAALLRRRVLFMLGLYRGGQRYEVIFEPLADFEHVGRHERAAAIEAAVARYGQLLEQHCRNDPYNWFNFFDFWRQTAPETPSGPTERPASDSTWS
jgi:predicted LPLAT superfamily acyltransferase